MKCFMFNFIFCILADEMHFGRNFNASVSEGQSYSVFGMFSGSFSIEVDLFLQYSHLILIVFALLEKFFEFIQWNLHHLRALI